jgi:hypothetical protein
VAELILGPMLRHVGRTSATIWFEADAPCTGEVLGFRARTFCVEGHYYGLVIVENLEPGREVPYELRLDDEVCWPRPDSTLPPATIRPIADAAGGDVPLRLLVGSCRAAAPHEPPWSLDPQDAKEGRGVDSLRAHGLRMLQQPSTEWPDLLVLVGDQVYADDPSPRVRDRIRRRSRRPRQLDDGVVSDFEEYTWLYRESWTPEIERWMFSVVPSTMIFDDHDMIDDWNISASWVRHIRRKPWWREHVIGGLVSYWIYQHLGNLPPSTIEDEGILARITEVDDAAPLLREWAEGSEEFTPVPGGYKFSYSRDLGSARLVVVDCRNGRVLESGERAMIDEEEWAWIVGEACRPRRHLLVATSLPVFVPGGLHDLQSWNERVCDGAWGRAPAWVGERLRRALDLEDWPAFRRSFDAFLQLLRDVGSGRGPCEGVDPPATITVLSGDIHFTYRATLEFDDSVGVVSRVNQVTSSPIRNALARRDRNVLRFASSRVGLRIGKLLRRSVRVETTIASWEIVEGPLFGNCMAGLTITGDACELTVESAQPDDNGDPKLDAILHAQL